MAKHISENIRTRRAWVTLIVLVLLFGLWFIKPYISIIALALLVSYLTQPIYKWFLKLSRRRTGIAATLTTTSVLLIIGIPIVTVLAMAVLQGLRLIQAIDLESIRIGTSSISTFAASIADHVNSFVADLSGINNALSAQSVADFFKNFIPSILSAGFNIVFSFISSIPNFFVSAVIFLFVYIGSLTNSDGIGKTIRVISPFSEKINELYFKRIGAMASSMFKGQLLIAFLQGLGSAMSLAVIGWGRYFWFFLVLFTFMSIIPLGTGILTIPLGVILLLTGHIWQGLLVLIVHFLYVTNIDNIRPKLVAKEARMPAALTIISAFAGIAYFGLLGVIYGPIIMIFILTTIELYGEHQAEFKRDVVLE